MPYKIIPDVIHKIVVNVELHGACGSCPFSWMTLKNGVEDAMKKAIPEVKSVEAVNL